MVYWKKSHALPRLTNPCIFRSGAAEDTGVEPDARPGSSKRKDVSPAEQGGCAQSRPSVSG
jgi:hypothetical protein